MTTSAPASLSLSEKDRVSERAVYMDDIPNQEKSPRQGKQGFDDLWF